ncbi:type II secretion system F family protein [Intrasporangium sp. YIM S08009]|uniref:type II secretion system F family protein n=1 Tax=Intrasporangium zincisolvens TaxID=3080018 RepID=UPI002B05649A|nr:type II secretion system F family protein [Intrasporangium sp. YIM S08009]
MNTVRRRLALVLAAAAAGLLALPSGARADDPVTVGLSSVTGTSQGSASTLNGVLTIRSKSDVQVDPSSLKVTIDGVDYPVTIKQAPKRDRRSIILIDTSGSMGIAGMLTVRKATEAYLTTVPADVKVGVGSFADTAGVDLPPTLDRGGAQRVVNGLASRGSTSLYEGVQDAVAGLGTSGDRSIMLLSDGADTMAKDPAKALAATVAKLKAADIRVDVVRFNTNDPKASAALQQLASASGGSVVAAANSAAVASAFKSAAQALNKQVQVTITVPKGLDGLHDYTITGTAGGQPFTFAKQATFTAPAATPAKPAPAPSGAGVPAAAAGNTDASLATVTNSDRTPLIAAGLLGLALLVGIGAAVTPTLQTKREQRVAAIETYVAGTDTTYSRQDMKAAQSNITAQLLDIGDRVMKDRKSTSKTMALIEKADLPFRAGEWLILRVVAVVVAAAVGFVLAGEAKILGLVIGAVFGIIVMPAGLRFAASRRAAKFEAQLPGILLLVSTSLRSGFGLPQALEAVARDAAEPAGKEFSRALAETRIGTDLPDAMERVALRLDSDSMHWTVMAIRIQREVGGNLADTLRTTANTLREREALYRQVKTLSAEGRLSAYILIALPICIFFYMMNVNYSYVSQLWTTTLGLFMLVGGLISLGIGVVWMRNVVKIEV